MIRRRSRTSDVVDAIRSLGDGLRSGLSLRQAFVRAAGTEGSPLAPAAAALAAGRPLVPALRQAAAETGDADLRSVLCVLAVHAEAGGDPLPATGALAERLSRSAIARAEARALTTQARLGARALLLLTPAFLLLVGATDPRGAADWLRDPRTRLAIICGLALQGLGAVWIGAIVRTAVGEAARASRIPVARAVRAVLAGRPVPSADADAAEAADTMALALDAGLAPTAALDAVASYVPGEFGAALRDAASEVGVRGPGALTSSLGSLEGKAPQRFADAYVSSVDLGVPLAPALRSLADDLREQTSIRLAEDVRRASVRVLIPLGLLILPAFVLACLVPLFLGGLEGIAG